METQFEKKFLYKNEKGIESHKEVYKVYLDALNDLCKEASTLLRRKLTREELISLKDEGLDLVINNLRKTYQFKDASDEFNCQALGVSLTDIAEAEKVFKRYRSRYDAALSNGKFVSMNKEIEKIEEANTFYTVNEKQNKALDFGARLEKLMDEAWENNLFRGNNKLFISNLFDFMEAKGIGKDQKIKLAQKRIRNLR